jgi:hypothetical protein
VSDFLDEKRAEITTRLAELKPQVDEYQRLEAAVAALTSVVGATSAPRAQSSSSAASAPSTRRRKPGRPRKSSTRSSTTSKPRSTASSTGERRGGGRPKGSGVRAAQAVALVQAEPGITIPQLALKMGIKQNYLYRVLPGLEAEGKVKKQGREWHPGS